MALLPLGDGNPPLKPDRVATVEVPYRAFATEQAWGDACLKAAERIGRCIPFPHVVTYDWERARDCMRVTVETRADAL